MTDTLGLKIYIQRPGVLDHHCSLKLDVHAEDPSDYKFLIISYGPVYVNGSAIPTNTPTKECLIPFH